MASSTPRSSISVYTPHSPGGDSLAQEIDLATSVADAPEGTVACKTLYDFDASDPTQLR